MRRALAVSWALGTSAGVFLGLLGVQLVTSGIRDARVSPLSRPEVLQALDAGDAGAAADDPVVSGPPGGTAPSADPGAESPSEGAPPVRPKPPAGASLRPGATANPPAAAAPPETPAATAPPGANPPATSPPATSPPPASPSTTAPAKANPGKPDNPGPTGGEDGTSTDASVQTISARGGTVAVRYEGDRVELMWARPNPGYDVKVKSEGPKQVSVRFADKKQQSWVLAYYEGGQRQHRVIERDGNSESEPSFGGGGKDVPGRRDA